MRHVFAISAYKESPYLEECILSLLAQEGGSEVFLCTSTPSEYLRKLSEQYHLPLFVRDGQASLRDDWNFCLRTAREQGADLCTIAHQDDVYLPGYKKAVTEAFEAYEDRLPALVVFTGVSNINACSEKTHGGAEKVKKVLRFPLRYPVMNRSKFWKRAALSFGNPVPCPACTYSLKELREDVFQTDSHFVTDWEALLKIAAKKGRLICIEKPLMNLRIHADQETARTMRDGERTAEEAAVFASLHTKPVAALLTDVYKNAQKTYEKDSK